MADDLDIRRGVDPEDAQGHGEPAPEGSKEPLWRHMLGERLRERRNDRGETLTDIATRAGVSPQYLSEIERGRKEPSSEIIAAVTAALHTTLLDLTIEVARSLAKVGARDAEVTSVRATFVLAA